MNNDLHKAIRNKRILAWYKTIPLIGTTGVTTRSSIIVSYAKHLGCPLAEIVSSMDGEADLDFIYEKHAKEIDKA